MRNPVVIGVSACLLGEDVRYDGGQKHDSYITGILGKFFALLPVCPEVEAGMTIPREPMRLEGDPCAPRLITIEKRVDMTSQMLSYIHGRIRELEEADISGFIFKKRSPSCGPSLVQVYNSICRVKTGVGLFARAVMSSFPLLPYEDEERLSAPMVRKNFIERVLSYRRWKDFVNKSPDIGELMEFHSRHKLLIMAHSPSYCRNMGELVDQCRESKKIDLFRKYGEMFMKAMSFHATISKNTKVLLHVLGYFKKALSIEEKAGLLEKIEQYKSHLVPLIVPITLLKHYARKYNQDNLAKQIYLSSYSVEMKLHTHT